MQVVITSPQNEQVKLIKGLSRRKNRDEAGLFAVEGLRGALEGIKSGAEPKQLAVSESFFRSPDMGMLSGLLGDFSGRIDVFGDRLFATMCGTETPQGIIGLFAISEPAAVSGESVVLLENVQDPGNMGTIIRTADAAGFDAIICGRGCVDAFNPKAVRSTVGSIFHVPVVRSDRASADEALLLKKAGYTLYAAHPRGGRSCFEETFPGKTAIVIGNEANGLSEEMLDACDVCLTIPMPGKAESLNASVAAAILIYEKARKRLC
ncbi:MAG: RNA methyltransferase [Clostridia bacterium]|nr:RNA methyltransferase [Clostridia bacterium]